MEFRWFNQEGILFVEICSLVVIETMVLSDRHPKGFFFLIFFECNDEIFAEKPSAVDTCRNQSQIPESLQKNLESFSR